MSSQSKEKLHWIILLERGKGIDERDKNCKCKDPYPPYNNKFEYKEDLENE